MRKKEYVDILGVHISRVSAEQVKKRICEGLKRESSLTVFTPNPEIVMKAQKDENFKNTLNNADLLLADGVGITLASRLIRDPLPERITGIDTGEFILKLASEKGLPIFLLGGKPGVAKRAATEIKKKHPSINICGMHHGFFQKSGAENEKIIKLINESGAKILFVCFGAPMQEFWILENKKRLNSVKLYIGLGGAMDVWSTDIRRAPQILQTTGFEWLWRILKEPRRASFVFRIPSFLYKVVCRKISN